MASLEADPARNGRLSIFEEQEPELAPVRLSTIWWLCAGAVAGLIIGAVGATGAAQRVTAPYWALGVSLGLSLAGGIATVLLVHIRNQQLFLALRAADGLADLANTFEREAYDSGPSAALQVVGGIGQAQVILSRADRLYERLVSASALNEARTLDNSISRFREELSRLAKTIG